MMLALVTFDGCRTYDPSVTAFLPRALLARTAPDLRAVRGDLFGERVELLLEQ